MTKYSGPERRKFVRLECSEPLAYKVCKKETVDKLLQGYTADVSQAGLLCTIHEPVEANDILWLSFDRSVLVFCSELEHNCLIYQNGIIGKVVRVTHKSAHDYDIGVQFIVRSEKDLSHIYPKIHFLRKQGLDISGGTEDDLEIDEEEAAETVEQEDEKDSEN